MSKEQKTFTITDTVKSIRASKIRKDTPRKGERFWVVKCETNTVRFFESEFKDESFVKLLESKQLVGKRATFDCKTFWNHVFTAKVH